MIFSAWNVSIFVNKFSKSLEVIIALVGKNASLTFWIKFWLSRIKDFVFLQKVEVLNQLKEKCKKLGVY